MNVAQFTTPIHPLNHIKRRQQIGYSKGMKNGFGAAATTALSKRNRCPEKCPDCLRTAHWRFQDIYRGSWQLALEKIPASAGMTVVFFISTVD